MYNGNISEASWKTSNDNQLRSYNYLYDKLNRITAANSLGTDAGKYSNAGITYDYNGNILTMTRNGWQNSATFTNMDVLTYNYDGNKLQYVKDDGNVNYGFVDGNTGTAVDYTYGDANGNMTADKNKKITGIVYNLLNLPQSIVTDQGSSKTGTISFAYDANGVKQRKLTVLNGPGIHAVPYIVEYAGSYVYEGNQGGVTDLQYFNQAEGYVRPINVGAQTYQYVYQFRDHLGNNRLSYTDDDPSTVVHITNIEESNYDAFGFKHQGYNSTISSLGNARAQALKYNGKELQEDYGLNWYDYGARFYDAAIGRWHVVDPLAEKSRRWSPYNYCMDNPIRLIDPDGMWPILPNLALGKAALMAFKVVTGIAIKSDQLLEDASGKNKYLNVPAGVQIKNPNGEAVGNSKDLNYVKNSTPIFDIPFKGFEHIADALGAIDREGHPDNKKSTNESLVEDRNTKVKKEERESVTPPDEPSAPDTEGNIDILNKDGSWSFDRYTGKTDSARKVTNFNNKNNLENGYKYKNAVKIIPNPY